MSVMALKSDNRAEADTTLIRRSFLWVHPCEARDP
jgi:hypothetical protein